MQAIEHIRYFAGWADKIYGKVAPCAGNMQATVYKEPLGKLRHQSIWESGLDDSHTQAERNHES